jgi:hypothetical protein
MGSPLPMKNTTEFVNVIEELRASVNNESETIDGMCKEGMILHDTRVPPETSEQIEKELCFGALRRAVITSTLPACLNFGHVETVSIHRPEKWMTNNKATIQPNQYIQMVERVTRDPYHTGIFHEIPSESTHSKVISQIEELFKIAQGHSVRESVRMFINHKALFVELFHWKLRCIENRPGEFIAVLPHEHGMMCESRTMISRAVLVCPVLRLGVKCALSMTAKMKPSTETICSCDDLCM